MSVTWGRILVGSAVTMCLLGVGVLEVLSERGPVRAVPEPARVGDARSEPWGELGRATPTLTADTDASMPGAQPGLTGAVQQRRLTVLEVNERTRRLVSLTGTGRVLVTDLSRDPFVVTEDRGASSLALLKPGDVVRIEPVSGRTQRIIVLRHGWQELESLEK
jgi:hypothetical protein